MERKWIEIFVLSLKDKIIVSVKLILGKLITLETWVQGIHNDIVRALETRCRDSFLNMNQKPAVEFLTCLMCRISQIID